MEEEHEVVRKIVTKMNQLINRRVHNNMNTTRQTQQINNMRLVGEVDYCSKSDAYKYFHPDVVMKDIVTIRDAYSGLVRDILKDETFDSVPLMFLTKNNTQCRGCVDVLCSDAAVQDAELADDPVPVLRRAVRELRDGEM